MGQGVIGHHANARRAEVVALHLVDLELAAALQRVRRDKGAPRLVPLPPSAIPRPEELAPGPPPARPGHSSSTRFPFGCLVRSAAGPVRMTTTATWKICRERGPKVQIQAPAPHHLRRTSQSTSPFNPELWGGSPGELANRQTGHPDDYPEE
jgi:integrase